MRRLSRENAVKLFGSYAAYCEVWSSHWLANGNEAEERGNAAKAREYFAKSQHWLDKANAEREWN